VRQGDERVAYYYEEGRSIMRAMLKLIFAGS
jgi:hypothetical protein